MSSAGKLHVCAFCDGTEVAQLIYQLAVENMT